MNLKMDMRMEQHLVGKLKIDLLQRCVLVLLICFCASTVFGQSISGSSTASAGDKTTYRAFDDQPGATYSWGATNGSASRNYNVGLYHKTDVTWITPGAGTVTLYINGVKASTFRVTITDRCAPPKPTATFSSSGNLCGAKTVTFSGTPPSDQSWYWQGLDNPGGKSTNPNVTITAYTSGVYYLRAYSSSTGCWSTSQGTVVTINNIPPAPTLESNNYVCGNRTIRKVGAPPANINWYWQGTNANGEDVTSAVATASEYLATQPGTYYLRAKSAEGCWSAANSINITIAPPAISYPFSSTGYASLGSVVLANSQTNLTYQLSRSPVGTADWKTWQAPKDGQDGTALTWQNLPSGQYTIIASYAGNNCPLNMSGAAAFYPIATATNTILPYGGSTIISTPSVSASYQWMRNGVNIPGATSQSISVNRAGEYKVKIVEVAGEQEAISSAAIIGWTWDAKQAIGGPAQQTGFNIESNTIVLVEGVKTLDNFYDLPTNQYKQAITYKDGLDRPYQQVLLGQSTNGRDIITAYSYERTSQKSFLPYVGDSRDGRSHYNAITDLNYPDYTHSEQWLFYQIAPKVAHDAIAYAEVRQSDSPLGHVREQAAQGAAWAIQANGAGHTVKSDFVLNTTTQVRYWKPDGKSTSYYDLNQLAVAQVTDENAHQVRTFTDKTGRTILKQVQLDETVLGKVTPWLETYYLYDIYGNLKYQVPPKALAAMSTKNSFDVSLPEAIPMLYSYTYDARGRLTEKKEPGAAAQYLVYDAYDRLVLTQDGYMRSFNKWAFIKYDAQTRPVLTGLYTHTTSATQLQMQTYLNTQFNAATYFEKRGATLHGYTNVCFPMQNGNATALDVWSVNYYDTYDFDYSGTDDYSYTSQGLAGEGAQASSYGLPTGNKKIVLGTSTWLYNYTFYDRFGRAIQTRSNNHLSTEVNNLTTLVYDFEGKVLQTKTNHATSMYSAAVTTQQAYDATGRVTSITQSLSQDVTEPVGQAIQWTNLLNVTVSSNSLTNTGGAYWEDRAFSLNSIPANSNGYIEFNVGTANSDFVIGISSSDGSLNNSINYGILVQGGSLYVVENNNGGSPKGTYVLSDRLRVERRGTTVVYLKNGIIFYTSSIPSTSSLYADCNLNTLGSIISNISMGTVHVWDNAVNVAIDGTSLTKTGATIGWDAGAFSVKPIPANADGWVEYTAGEITTAKMMGLSATDADASYASINYAWYPFWDGNLYIYENGSLIGGPFTDYSTNDILRVERLGTTILYKKNGKVIYTSTVPSSSILYADCSFYNVNASFKNIGISVSNQVAQYEYNVLGQLIDKKLHNTGGTNFLQSVDYRYNIRGWLTSINNAQLNSDASAINDDTNDYFGMELFYNMAEPSALGNTPYYNGNVSAAKWKNAGTPSGAGDQRSYTFTYDKSDRLKQSNFKGYNGSVWGKENGTLNENISYDQNGNIINLSRNKNLRGLSGVVITSTAQSMDNLGYSYINGNQLNQVSDSAPGSGGFVDGASSITEFAYNANGSLTKDENKGISNITYNALGKPQVVTFSSTPTKTITYTYDAAGNKLKVVTNDGTTTTTTDYVGGFVYTNNALSFFSSPEGRVVKNGSGLEYQYAIADHLGNTRVLFTSATPTAQVATATFEDTEQPTEAGQFQNYPSTAGINVVASNNHTEGGTKSQYLNGGYMGMVGVAKSYKVYPGDKVQIDAYARYNAPSATNSSLTNFAGALLAAFALPTPGVGETGTASSAVQSWGAVEAGGFADGSPANGLPKAFVNIILFDKNYKLLNFSFAQVTSSGVSALVTQNITVKEAGYAFVYVSNEHPTQTDVYFDDVKMTYTPSNLLQGNEYYPYGLQTANSWTRENTTGNNFLANSGTELNTTSNLYDLDYRNYDPVLGRMHQIDPLASKYSSLTPYNYSFNDPVSFSDPSGADPDGGCSWCHPLPNLHMDYAGSSTGPSYGYGGFDRAANFFNPGWRPGMGSLSAGMFAQQDAAYRNSTSFTTSDRGVIAAFLNAYNGNHRVLYGASSTSRGYQFIQIDGGGNFYVPYTDEQLDPAKYLSSFQTQGGPGDGRPTSDDPYDGHAIGISVDWVLGGGFNFSIGYVVDKQGNGSFFYSGGPSVGFAMGIGGFASSIKAVPGKKFDVSKYEGYGSAWEGTIFGSYTIGGDTEKKWHNNYGFTYVEEKGGYGWGIPVGLTYQFSKTVLIK
jgi:RHS repeat-associated protein